MKSLPAINKPAYYVFRVYGRLSQQSAPWFEGMDVRVDEIITPIQIIIKGYIEDQAALHGLISRIRDLGLDLLSIKRVEQKEDS
jgi:hypothetical protein